MTEHAHSDATITDPTAFWEDRYGQSGQVWSGKANAVVTQIAADLTPGRALDIGCGEGGDVIWLTTRGWQVTGVDISATAIGRARTAAAAAGVADRIQFIAADLTTHQFDCPYDLVTSSFFHSPVALDRTEILRRGAAAVAPGGHLLLVTHTAFPPGSNAPDPATHHFLTPEQELAELALDSGQWSVKIAETRPRTATAPRDGQPVHLDDGVLLLQRR